ncbi:SDR family NAD(P)-dependent oxidoreductase [Compostimonas suwonensis]|uniref:2-keto-3-deoxy-L-fuconate dehydrogenase n=1 Tax=Compostimonas suwonensis TaxID=1048394 RepID=A0A2M9BWW3_9MICO|nr:SDR family oxidoreductase [Compostimonas suwonensis]PJJ62411.1 2-keto-3-deoxy-L-fuconate dehydrogenase [Compostimonas suwonensis]
MTQSEPAVPRRRLDGKRVLLTGAAQGMGEATARMCVAEGASVVLVDREPHVEEVANGLGMPWLVGDVSDRSTAAKAVDLARAELGGLDALGNIAGTHCAGDIIEMKEEDWERALAVNLLAPLWFSQLAIPLMLDDGGGSIVNICSVSAVAIIPGRAGYNTTKHALLGLTRSVALDFGPRGVRCNAISPGMTLTRFSKRSLNEPGRLEHLLKSSFVGRLGQPEDIAPACVYLFSDESGFTNGANIVIDGGRTVFT